jgi:hypothetical protein
MPVSFNNINERLLMAMDVFKSVFEERLDRDKECILKSNAEFSLKIMKK